ncbi:AAA family ATPase [Methanospirillum sp.]
MITYLQIENFKSIQNSGQIHLKPITILVGANSSGKSSILKSLLLLKQTAESSNNRSPLVPNGDLLNLGSYSNFIFNKKFNNKLSFEIHFDDIFNKEGTIQGKFDFRYLEGKTEILLSKSEIIASGYKQKIWKKSSRSKYYSILFHRNKKQEEYKIFDGIIPIKFFDFIIHPDKIKDINDIQQHLYPYPFIIRELFNRIYYIGPLRKYPQRIYFPSGNVPRDVGKSGENAIDALWYSKKYYDSNNVDLEQITTIWFQKFGFSSNFKLKLLEKSHSIYEILIGNSENTSYFNITDVGFGVSQTLPIIIECYYAPKNSTLLIEQPEIHLHPKAQATLGDLFIESAIKGSRQLIIETHSEHLLSRIRRRIAEDSTLSSDDVCILFFEKIGNKTTIKEIALDECGRYKEYLSGFFEEEYEESIEHLKAISKKMNYD